MLKMLREYFEGLINETDEIVDIAEAESDVKFTIARESGVKVIMRVRYDTLFNIPATQDAIRDGLKQMDQQNG